MYKIIISIFLAHYCNFLDLQTKTSCITVGYIPNILKYLEGESFNDILILINCH